MTPMLDTLASYVPAAIIRRLAVRPDPLRSPLAEHQTGALLLADISDFTRLTAEHAAGGPAGAEALGRTLNGIFAELIDLVHAHGGDVLTFAGDALLAFWPVEDSPPLRDDTVAAERAATCALTIQAMLHHRLETADRSVTLRIGIAAGPVILTHVGGVGGRWEMLVTGTCLSALSLAKLAAVPGEVVCAAETWPLLAEHFIGDLLDGGHVRLTATTRALRWRRLVPPALHSDMQRALHQYLPPSVRERLLAGQTDWLADLRVVTALFVNLPEIGAQTPLAETQAVMTALQGILQRYEGSIKELTTDDHGVALVAVFGLPPLSHADDAVRGVQAALQIEERLQAMGLAHRIGIATGRTFCGVVGNERRRQLAIIGDAMILAARLMQTSPGPVWCDAATFQATRGRLGFTELAPVTFKGHNEPLPVYVPVGLVPSQPNTGRIVGRQHELDRLSELLEHLVVGHHGSLCLIEGDAGIGKTRIMQAFAGLATTRGALCLSGRADPYDQTVPYRSWRPVIAELFGLAESDSKEQGRAQVLEVLQGMGERADLAPLLNAVLHLEFAETARTEPMSGKLRGEQLRQLLIVLLEREAQSRPLILMFEDTHWMDPASWTLLGQYSRAMPTAMLLMSFRPQAESGPSEFAQLRHEPRCHRFLLGTLTLSDVAKLAADRMGVAEVPEPIVRFIFQRAEGHPLFSEEVTSSLRDAGLLVNRAGICHGQGTPADLARLDVPATVAGVITNRVDRLDPSQQLTLKVASVIGRRFTVRQLHDIFPVPAHRDRLPEHLDALKRQDLISLGPFAGEITYQFKHAITHDVVYGLMLFEQRQQLHKAMAEWLESHHATDLATLYPDLAHHWSRAGDALKAVHYLDLAGEQALQRGASTEAIAALTEANNRSNQLGLQPSTAQRAQRERLLGTAQLEAGHLPEALLHFELSLSLLGIGMPQGRGRLLTLTLKAVAIQLWRQAVPARPTTDPARQAVLAAVVATYEDLRETYLFSHRMPQFLFVGLLGLNAVERLGQPGPLSRAYAGVCVMAAHVGLGGLAARYAQRALAQIARVADPAQNLAALIMLGAFHIGQSDWGTARQLLEKALHASDRLGDRKQWGYGMALLAQADRCRGDHTHACELIQTLYDMAVQHQDIQQQAWCLSGLAQSRFRQGQIVETRRLLAEADGHYAVSHDQLHSMNHRALRALVLLHDGQPDQARHIADELIAQLQSRSARIISTLNCHQLLAEISLTLWETVLPSSRPCTYTDIERCQLACGMLTSYARLFPVARPAAYLYQGLNDWLGGRQARARQAWHLGLESALHQGAAFEQARLHYQIGRHLPERDPARDAHLERSYALLAELGLPSQALGIPGQLPEGQHGSAERDPVSSDAAPPATRAETTEPDSAPH